MDGGTRPGGLPGDLAADSGRDAVLALNVHGAQTHIGLFERDALVDDWWTETRADAKPKALAADLTSMLARRDVDVAELRGSIVSSTVPSLSRTWPLVGEECLGKRMLVMGSALRTGMPIRVEHPGELGANRIVNAVAAYERVGGPCIVVDFGTTIAFDVVSKAGEYMGSIFTPGLDIPFGSVAAGATAVFGPQSGQRASLGTKTASAFRRTGTVYGTAGLCDGIVARIMLEMGDTPTVVATGPRASFIAELCDTIEHVDTSLTLAGLQIIHARNS